MFIQFDRITKPTTRLETKRIKPATESGLFENALEKVEQIGALRAEQSKSQHESEPQPEYRSILTLKQSWSLRRELFREVEAL